jgi:hypothetical protein
VVHEKEKAGMGGTSITGFGAGRLTRRPRSFSRWHTCMRSAGRPERPVGQVPRPHRPRKFAWLCTTTVTLTSELLADQGCFTKDRKKTEHPDGTRLNHDAIWYQVSCLRPNQTSILLVIWGRLLADSLVTPSSPTPIVHILPILFLNSSYPTSHLSPAHRLHTRYLIDSGIWR